jgi:hypothetical protein
MLEAVNVCGSEICHLYSGATKHKKWQKQKFLTSHFQQNKVIRV